MENREKACSSGEKRAKIFQKEKWKTNEKKRKISGRKAGWKIRGEKRKISRKKEADFQPRVEKFSVAEIYSIDCRFLQISSIKSR